MKKTFKFMGIALLAAGVSFAVSSCEKEVATTPEQEEVVVEETVDFEEITKADFDDIKDATDEVKKAIESIVKGIAGLYSEAEEIQDKVSYKFESALFDLFTNAFRGSTGEITVNLGDVFKTALEIAVGHQGYPTSGTQVNGVKVEFTEGTLTLTTKEDYQFQVVIPGWAAWVKDEGKFVSGFTCSNEYVVSLRKVGDKYPLAKGTFAFGKTVKETTADIVLIYKGRVLEATYNFCPYHFVMYGETLVVSFNNYYATEDHTHAYSDIKVKNLDDLFWALSEITNDTYSYTDNDAAKIVAAFNENVTNAYAEVSFAQVRKKKLEAVAVKDLEYTELNRVVVYYGPYDQYGEFIEEYKKIVTPGKVIQVLKDKWEEIFGVPNNNNVE